MTILIRFYGPESWVGFGLDKLTPVLVQTRWVKAQSGLSSTCHFAYELLEMSQTAWPQFANAKLQRQSYVHFLKVGFERSSWWGFCYMETGNCSWPHSYKSVLQLCFPLFNFLPLYPSYSPLDNQKEFLSLCTVYTLQAFVYTSISLFIAFKKNPLSLATLFVVLILCSLGISWSPSTIGNILGKVSLFHMVFLYKKKK